MSNVNTPYSADILKKAAAMREETDRMNQQIMEDAQEDSPNISPDQLAAWDTMNVVEKHSAYTSGQYQPRPVMGPEVAPISEPESPGPRRIISDEVFRSSMDRTLQSTFRPRRIFTEADDERPGVDGGIATQQENRDHFTRQENERRNRINERRDRVVAQQAEVESPPDMSPEEYEQWNQRVQERAEEPLTPIQRQYRARSNYAGEIPIEDFAPGLRERDPEQWRFLVESFPKGIPIEHLSAESEVEWSLMDERHNMPVANIDHMVSVIARTDVSRQVRDRSSTELLSAVEKSQLSIDLYPAAEARAKSRVNHIRQSAQGNHIALFDPAGKSLGEIVEGYRASEQGYMDYFGSIADAWWHGAGSAKSSLLYTDNKALLVETEGLLDFSFRGVPGIIMSPMTTDVEAIAEVYHGIGFERHAQEVGEELTAPFLRSMSYTPAGLVAGAVMGESIADNESAQQWATDVIATSWTWGMTIAAPDLFTVATGGLGAALRVPRATAAAARAGTMQQKAQAAAGVSRAQQNAAAARSGREAFVQGWKNQEEAALMSSISDYLAIQGKNAEELLQQARTAGDVTTPAGRQAIEVAERGIIQDVLQDVQDVVGRPQRDIIESQWMAAMGSSRSGVTIPVADRISSAVAAESRLAKGVAPVQWEAQSKARQAASQAAGAKPIATTGVTEGGMAGARSAGRKPVKLGTTSKKLPVARQEEAISMIKSAVDSGKFIWKGLKGKVNPATGKAWTTNEIEAIAKLELRATEAAHIAHAAHLAELRSRAKMLGYFSKGKPVPAADVQKLAKRANIALDKVRDLRRQLIRWDAKGKGPRHGATGDFQALQKQIEAARKIADKALLDYGKAAGSSARSLMAKRIAKQQAIATKVQMHLSKLGTGIATNLGGKGPGAARRAGLHNVAKHAERVKSTVETVNKAYAVPGYRKLTSIIRQTAESHSGLAAAWRSDAWRKAPTYKEAVKVLTKEGFLGKKAGPTQPADFDRLKVTLEKLFPKAVIEHMALSKTPESAALRDVLGINPQFMRQAVSVDDLAKNVTAIVKENRSLQIATHKGAIAQAANLQKQMLMLYNPAMVKGVFAAMSSKLPFVRSMHESIRSFAKPWFNKVGWGRPEVVELMKGVENMRKTWATRLTYAATVGKTEDRFDAVSRLLNDKAWAGDSLFDNGISLLRDALNSKDRKLEESLKNIFMQLSRSYIDPSKGTPLGIGEDKLAALTKSVKDAIRDGSIKTWDDLKKYLDIETPNRTGAPSTSASIRATASTPATEFQMLKALRGEVMAAQALVTAGALQIGFRRSASITAHVSEEGLKNLSKILTGAGDARAAQLGYEGFQEALEVAARLGVPPALIKSNNMANDTLRHGLQVVYKDGGITFLNQRVIDSVVETLKGVIKEGDKYNKKQATTAAGRIASELNNIWRFVLRSMTTGVFHLGYFANMVYGNVSQAFAEASVGAAMAVASSSVVGTGAAALIKLPGIGPKLEAKYAKLKNLTLPDPSLAMVDIRSNAIMNTKMLSDSVEMSLPSGQRMTMGAYRRELQEQGVFTSLTSNIAPISMARHNRQGAVSRLIEALTGSKVDIKPSRLITYPMEQSTRMFDHLEVLQRITLYNYLRLNKGYSKGRAGQIMRNSLYDWNFATSEADTFASKIIMFYNFHKLALGRGLAHIVQPMKAGYTGGSSSFINNVLRTSPIHPDAFASARINMFERVNRELIERPGREEAGVGKPSWSKLTQRGFVGGGQLTQEQRIAIQNVTGRDATEFTLSMPAPTPQGVMETLYGFLFMGIKAISGEGERWDLPTFAAKELASRANPLVSTGIQALLEKKPPVQELVKLTSPVDRLIAQHLRSAGIISEEFSDVEGAGVMQDYDSRMTMRVRPYEKALYGLMLMPLRRKLDPIIEAEALDRSGMDALQYWLFQNTGYRKTHFTNPRSEAAYIKNRIEREVQEEQSRLRNQFPGGVEPQGTGFGRGPSLQRQEVQDRMNTLPQPRSTGIATGSQTDANAAMVRAFRRLAEQE